MSDSVGFSIMNTSLTDCQNKIISSTLNESNQKELVSHELMAYLSPHEDDKLGEALLRLNLASLWQWILCFCIVDFDLEIGQGRIIARTYNLFFNMNSLYV